MSATLVIKLLSVRVIALIYSSVLAEAKPCLLPSCTGIVFERNYFKVSQQKEELVEERVSGCLCASPGSRDLRGAGPGVLFHPWLRRFPAHCSLSTVTSRLSLGSVAKQLQKSHLGAGIPGWDALHSSQTRLWGCTRSTGHQNKRLASLWASSKD